MLWKNADSCHGISLQSQPSALSLFVVVPTQRPLSLCHISLLLFATTLPTTTKHATDVSTSRLGTRPDRAAHALRSTGDGFTTRFGRIGYRVRDAGSRAPVRATVVFAPAFSSVDAFLGHSVANRLQHAALPKLSAHSTIHPILQLVHRLNTSDLRFVQRICIPVSISTPSMHPLQHTCPYLSSHTTPYCPW